MITFISQDLFPKQQEIATAITSTKDIEGEISWHIVNSSRQFGKSYLLRQILLYYAINEPDSKNLFVSMSYQQSNKVYGEILRMVEKTPLIKSKNVKEKSVTLMNGSEIYVRSYQKCDYIRGISANTLIIDEAAFVREDDFNAILRPTLATIGRRGLLFSTPRGKNFFFRMATNHSPNYHYYYATYRDNPYANRGEIEDARKTLPEKIFRSEYEAEFIDGGMSVFYNVEKCIRNGLLPSGAVCCAGLDVGRNSDYTVLTIMSGSSVVYQEQWNQDTWESIISSIVRALRQYNVRYVSVEVNGLGDPFYEMLMTACKANRLRVQLNPFLTTNVSKQCIVERLIQDFATENILIPNNEDLLLQLGNFECEYSAKSKTVIYSGKMNGKDDRVMSLAICNDARHSVPSGNYHIRLV